MANRRLSDDLSVPLDGATSAKVEIDTGAGNLTVDSQTGGDQLLASGRLQYFEKQGVPAHSLSSSNGRAVLTVRGDGPGAGRPWFLFPWAACGGGAYEWQIHLNPTVSSDITAHSGGGNVKLDLAGMAVTRLSADSGGGNMDVVLPDDMESLSVVARTGGGNVSVEIGNDIRGTGTIDASSGAGNVVVRIPTGIAARIHASSGLGKVIVDSRFSKIDKHTYQSQDYDVAASKVDITAKTGAGNVSINTR